VGGELSDDREEDWAFSTSSSLPYTASGRAWKLVSGRPVAPQMLNESFACIFSSLENA